MLRSAVAAAFFVLAVLAAPSGGQTPAPLTVEADQITFDEPAQVVEAEGSVRLRYQGIRLTADRARFDLRQEQVTAEGHVVLVDASGRELRGHRLRYDVRLQLAEVEQAQAIVERVYVSSARLRAQPTRVEAEDALVTTCDPARPAYRITATQIEIVPGERLVARNATLWLGGSRIFTVPVYTLSLRSGEETARGFSRAGYNHVDGVWVDYPFAYELGTIDGLLYAKLGSGTGLIARNTLAYATPRYSLALTVGRNQNEAQVIFDQAEVVVDLPDSPLGRLPLFYGLTLSSGWFRESGIAVETERSRYEVRLSTPTIPLGPRTSLSGGLSLQDAYYGTGARQTIPRAALTLTRQLDAQSTLSLPYRLFERFGATPFTFDAVAEKDLFHTAGLQYARTFPRTPQITATFGAGVSYNFRDQTPSVNGGYGARRPAVYHWNLGAEYNLTTRRVKVTTDSGAAIGGTYVTIQAAYFPQPGQFEDLDLLLTSRLCNCFDLILKYRHVRQELWLEVSLAPDVRIAFPEEGGQP